MQSILKFPSKEALASFSSLVFIGYLRNTSNLTLTGSFLTNDIKVAVKDYGACLVETKEKIFA